MAGVRDAQHTLPSATLIDKVASDAVLRQASAGRASRPNTTVTAERIDRYLNYTADDMKNSRRKNIAIEQRAA